MWKFKKNDSQIPFVACPDCVMIYAMSFGCSSPILVLLTFMRSKWWERWTWVRFNKFIKKYQHTFTHSWHINTATNQIEIAHPTTTACGEGFGCFFRRTATILTNAPVLIQSRTLSVHPKFSLLSAHSFHIIVLIVYLDHPHTMHTVVIVAVKLLRPISWFNANKNPIRYTVHFNCSTVFLIIHIFSVFVSTFIGVVVSREQSEQ